MRIPRFLGVLALLGVAVLAGTLFSGCGDDGSSPRLLTVADFEGYWEMTMYRLTNPVNPAQVVELKTAGASMGWIADNTGHFTGEAFVPATLAGQDIKFAFSGAIALVGQDSISVTFLPEIEPFLSDERAAMSLSGNVMTLESSDTTFDFDQDGTEEAAVFLGRMERTTRVLTYEDYAGTWEATSYKMTSVASPAVSIEIISMGATFYWDADDTGAFTGAMFLPAALAGEDMNVPFAGAFQLVGQDSAYVTFTPEVPPFLTETRAEFTVWGGTLNITDSSTTFDFDEDGTEEAAIFEGTMVWTGF